MSKKGYSTEFIPFCFLALLVFGERVQPKLKKYNTPNTYRGSIFQLNFSYKTTCQPPPPPPPLNAKSWMLRHYCIQYYTVLKTN